MNKTIDQLIEEAAKEYQDIINEISGNQAPYHVEAFNAGANFVKAEMQKEIDRLKYFWKSTLESFEKKYPITGHSNIVALTALTNSFDIYCKNEDLQKEIDDLNKQISYYKNGKQIKEVHYDDPTPYVIENEKLKALLDEAIECLTDLIVHVDASLLFPHKDRTDLFKSEQSAKNKLEKIKKEMVDA